MEVNQSTYYRFYRQVVNALMKMKQKSDPKIVEKNKNRKKQRGGITVTSCSGVIKHVNYHAALPKRLKTVGKIDLSKNTSDCKKVESLKELDRNTISLCEHQYGEYIDEKYREKFKQICGQIDDYESELIEELVREVTIDIFNTQT